MYFGRDSCMSYHWDYCGRRDTTSCPSCARYVEYVQSRVSILLQGKRRGNSLSDCNHAWVSIFIMNAHVLFKSTFLSTVYAHRLCLLIELYPCLRLNLVTPNSLTNHLGPYTYSTQIESSHICIEAKDQDRVKMMATDQDRKKLQNRLIASKIIHWARRRSPTP